MLPKTADIVIIGGGVMGTSVAYHLALRGQKNILLLEKDEFFGQEATGRCAGGVRFQFSTEINVHLSLQSLPMLDRFKDEIGQDINFRKCGYLFVLTRPEDVKTFRHSLELQQNLGVKTEWLSPDEVRVRLPLMRFEDALAGSFNPGEGLVDPNGVVMGYVGAAQRLGVQFLNHVEVTGIQVEAGKVVAVQTSQGVISTPVVVNAAGPWAGEVGKLAGVDIPIIPLRRQIMTTTPLPEDSAGFSFRPGLCPITLLSSGRGGNTDRDVQSERNSGFRPECRRGVRADQSRSGDCPYALLRKSGIAFPLGGFV